jgi:hypothetical protein
MTKTMTQTITEVELDQTYTALCNALNDVGESHAQSFLAMLSLSLMARADNAAEVLTLIENARTQAKMPIPANATYKNTSSTNPAIATPVINTPK